MGENKIIDFPGSLANFTRYIINKFDYFSDYLWGLSGIFFIVSLCYLTYRYCKLYSHENKKPVAIIDSSFFFLLFASLGILILRFPALGVNELNVDESEWISGAATLIKDGRFWLSVNGTTSGPLNVFPLCLINLSGFCLNYAAVRLFALIFIIIPTLILVFKSLKYLFSEDIARIITIPGFIFFAYTGQKDIIAFNSEHIPMVLFALAFYAFVKSNPFSGIRERRKNDIRYLFLCGIIIGLLPYSKLQSIPVAFTMFAFIAVQIFVFKNNVRIKLFSLSLGILSPFFVLLLYLFFFNLFSEFWNYYILNNFQYSIRGIENSSPTWYLQKFRTQSNWFMKFLTIPYMIKLCREILIFVASVTAISVFCLTLLLKKIKFISRRNKTILIFSFLILLSGYYSIIKPGNIFIHYFVLYIVPLLMTAGVLLGITTDEFLINKQKFIFYLKYYLILFAIAPCLILTLNRNSYIKSILEKNSLVETSAISKVLRRYSKPDDKLAVWGYANKHYVEAELIQGTREPQSYLQITESELQKYFTDKFCEDIRVNKPVIFLDAIGKYSFFYFDYNQRHENYPEIKKLVNEYYELKDSTDDTRIYIRRNQ